MKKILIVDDEEDVRQYLVTLFKNNGYEPLTARDGEEAIELVRKEKPDLVSLDITMPKKSGIRFYRDMKENEEFKKIPIIVVTGITGYGNEPDEFKKFISTRKQVPPPEGFMSKPIDRDELLKMINELLS